MQTKPLILWGGTDIDPAIYGQQPLKWTDTPDVERDDQELYEIDMAVRFKRPIIGICRGAQLLCAYNDGELIQHSNIVRPKRGWATLVTEEGEFEAPVNHHQIMVPKGNYVLLAEEEAQHTRWKSNDESYVEWYIPHVIYYPDTNSLAVQPHPEWDKRESYFIVWLNSIIAGYLGVKYNVF